MRVEVLDVTTAVLPLILATLTLLCASSASGLEIPGYELIDTVSVGARGEVVASSVSLSLGVNYKIAATGQVAITDDSPVTFGDAEYLVPRAGLPDPVDFCLSGGAAVCDYGIAINDSIVGGGPKVPSWGAYVASHEYVIDIVGLGTPVAFNYHDDVYDDNSGSITVEIFAAAPEPPAMPVMDTSGRIALATLIAVTLVVATGMSRQRSRGNRP